MSRSKHSLEETNGIQWETVGVPVGRYGADLRNNPRGRHPLSLFDLTNASFPDERVLARRNGHDALPVVGVSDSVTGRLQYTGEWIYGFGAATEQIISTNEFGLEVSGAPSSPLTVSPYARKGNGVFEHSGSLCAWTGDRVLLTTDSDKWSGDSPYWASKAVPDVEVGAQDGVPAFLPTDEVSLIRTSNADAITETAMADGDTTFCVSSNITGVGLVTDIFDRVSGSRLSTYVHDTSAFVVSDVQVLFSDGVYVVLYLDVTSDFLHMEACGEGSPGSWAAAITPVQTYDYDVAMSAGGSVWLLIRKASTTTVISSWYRGANPDTVQAATTTTLDTTGDVYRPRLCLRESDNAFLVLWSDGAGGIEARLYNAAGTALDAQVSVGDGTTAYAASRRRTASGHYAFVVYLETTYDVRMYLYNDGDITGVTERANCSLLSKPFAVGDEVFCWLRSSNTNSYVPQHLGFLLAGASTGTGVEDSCRVVGFAHLSEIGAPSHLSHPSRLPGTGGYQMSIPFVTVSQFSPTYSDGRTKVYRHVLNFLPKLSWAQIGQTTYLAGACLQSFDGIVVTEASIPQAPSVYSLTPTSGGSMSSSGQYRYRVYAVYSNNSGETIRSPALIWPEPSDSPVSMGGNSAVSIVIDTVSACTFGTNLKFEIYRTESNSVLQNGTSFYLCNTAVVSNSHAAATVTYLDTIADSELIKRQQDPAAPTLSPPLLETDVAPGCTVVVAGKDRLWLAGGSVPAGSVACSMLKTPSQMAGFNALTSEVQVDLDGRRITSMAQWQDNMVIFQRERVFALQGEGPNNLGLGGYAPAQLVAGHTGASTHFGTAVCENGILFWSKSGPRLLDGRLNAVNISAPMEPLAATMEPSGVAVIVGKREARWYTRDGLALLWDWTPTEDQYGRWSKWTGLKVAGALTREGQIAELVTTDGKLLRESPDVFHDGGLGYEFTFTTSDLRPMDTASGDNMLRQVGILGSYRGPHTLRGWIMYDGDRRPGERYTWAPGNNIDSTVWNRDATDWEAAHASDSLTSPDGVYRFLMATRRTQFSTIRLKFSDLGATTETFVPYEVVVEWGASAGPTKISNRTIGE